MKNMKNIKKIVAGVVIAGILGTAGIAYAAEYKTPAEIVSGLTGKTVESVTEERQEGTRYGTQAEEAGKLDEFKAAMLEQKKAILDQYVKDGKMTQEEADALLKQIEENMANCDGDGSGSMRGTCGGLGLGQGSQNGSGMGTGRGMGAGMGMRGGRGLRNGTGSGSAAATTNSL